MLLKTEMQYSPRKTASAEAGLLAVASRFEKATRCLIESRSLLNRTDTKFIVPASLAVWVLARVADRYKVVMNGPGPLAHYITDYYDTSDLRCFYDEMSGRRPRYKVRVRSYQDGKCFVETKVKDISERTRKHRLLRACRELEFSVPEMDLIAGRTDLPVDELTRSIGVDYDRLSVVSPTSDERVTVDVNITVRAGARRLGFPEVAIFETKQGCHTGLTPIMKSLQQHGLAACELSKYCSALAIADASLTMNRAAEMLRRLFEAEEKNDDIEGTSEIERAELGALRHSAMPR